MSLRNFLLATTGSLLLTIGCSGLDASPAERGAAANALDEEDAIPCEEIEDPEACGTRSDCAWAPWEMLVEDRCVSMVGDGEPVPEYGCGIQYPDGSYEEVPCEPEEPTDPPDPYGPTDPVDIDDGADAAGPGAGEGPGEGEGLGEGEDISGDDDAEDPGDDEGPTDSECEEIEDPEACDAREDCAWAPWEMLVEDRCVSMVGNGEPVPEYGCGILHPDGTYEEVPCEPDPTDPVDPYGPTDPVDPA